VNALQVLLPGPHPCLPRPHLDIYVEFLLAAQLSRLVGLKLPPVPPGVHEG
jgi:hypothetical protein